MTAIEKLFAAAEACLEYKSGWSTAMAAAIAPARAEIARLRAELTAGQKIVNGMQDEINHHRAALAAARLALLRGAGTQLTPAARAALEAEKERGT